MQDIDITISISEWDDVSRVLSFLDRAQSQALNAVCLRAVNGKRHWLAGNDVRAVCIEGDFDSLEYEVLIPGRAFLVGLSIAGEEGATRLRVVNGMLVIGEKEHSITYPQVRAKSPIQLSMFEPLSSDAQFEVHSRRLKHALSSLTFQAHTDEEITHSVLNISNIDNGLHLELRVFDEQQLAVTLPARHVSGPESVLVPVRPKELETLLLHLPFDEYINVSMPTSELHPIILASDGLRAVVMPLQRDYEVARENIENVLTEVCGVLSLITDGDGDYPITRHGHRIYGRLHGQTKEALFQIFAVILDDIEPTPELLAEINQINSNIGYARVFCVANQVLVEVDLVAVACDEIEIEIAVKRIQRVASEIAPMLNALFGGELHDDPVEGRWLGYLQAIVRAQITPVEWCDLNGVHAVEQWPFPGPVHVITGWNPQGLDFPGGEVNRKIASDILTHGGHFVEGTGGTADGTYVEPSLIAWGLSRETAVQIGRKASQDAIFELDASCVRLLDCWSDRIEELPRISQSQS
jgi:hypothetical protein